MSILLTANLTTGIANLGSGPWTPKTFTFGEDMTLALRFSETIEGKTIEPTLDLRAMKALIGYEDARPVSGTWTLQIGSGASTVSNTTTVLQHDGTAKDLKDAIAALTTVVATYGAPVVRKVDGSWLIVFGTGLAVVPLTVRHNQLFPTCLLHGSALLIDAQYHHELRFKQVPVAINDTLLLVLPPSPKITKVTAGATSGGFFWNEVQSLKVPLTFRASYELHYGFGRTSRLTTADGAEQIQAALEAVAGAGNVLVTDGVTGEALIEFTGDLKGTPVDDLVVVALAPPPGDMTFTLALDEEPLHSWLRAQRAVTLPLEVWITTADGAEVLTKKLAFRVDVTIQRPVDFDELAVVPVVDWLHPPSPVDYVPRSTGTIFTGTKSQAFVRGNGAATVFALAHGLSTQDIRAFGRINASGGRQLIHGTDFTAVIDNAAQVTVTSLIGAPATNTWTLYLEAVEPVAAFAGHTHTIGEITGLEARLVAIESAVASVLALIPINGISGPKSELGTTEEFTLAPKREMFPGWWPEGTNFVTAEAPRAPGGLLPAIHDASVGALTIPLVAASGVTGNVYQNTSGSSVDLPGAMGRRIATLKNNEYAGSDGRTWYAVTRKGSTTSYYPRDFERELYFLAMDDRWLRLGDALTVTWDLELQLLNANSKAQYLAAIEIGDVPQQSSPATTGVNLSDVTWNATPLAAFRFVLGPQTMKRKMGVSIQRSPGNVFTTTAMLSGAWSAGAVVPASANFALRHLLNQFDTENAVSDARGTVRYAFTNGLVRITHA